MTPIARAMERGAVKSAKYLLETGSLLALVVIDDIINFRKFKNIFHFFFYFCNHSFTHSLIHLFSDPIFF